MGAHPETGINSPVLAIRGNILVIEEIKSYLVGNINRKISRLILQVSLLLDKARATNELIFPALITWSQRAFDQELDEGLQYRDRSFRVEEQIAYDFYACIWRMSPAYIQVCQVSTNAIRFYEKNRGFKTLLNNCHKLWLGVCN